MAISNQIAIEVLRASFISIKNTWPYKQHQKRICDLNFFSHSL